MDGSDAILGFLFLALLVALFWGVVVTGLLFVVLIAGTLILLMLPWLVYGFIQGWRRKDEDSNPSP